MKKTYKIEVDCANCANLMEEAARKTAGVASATVNFMTQKMIVEFTEGQEPAAVMQEVLKACKMVEPDCEIELCWLIFGTGWPGSTIWRRPPTASATGLL